jgi:hypothetical protein
MRMDYTGTTYLIEEVELVLDRAIALASQEEGGTQP